MVNNTSHFRTAAVYGLALGGVSLLLSLPQYLAPEQTLFVSVSNILSTVVSIGGLVYLLRRFKKVDATRTFTFGLGMKVGAVMALVVALMSAVYIYAVFTFDAEYVESVRQQSLAQLAQSGLPREQMKVAVNSIEATLKPTTMFITTGLSSFVGNIIVVLVAMCFLKEAKTYNDVMDKL